MFCFLKNCKANGAYYNTAKTMKISIKDFFSKCEQIRWKPRILLYLLKKS